MLARPRVLIVDYNPRNLRRIRTVLTQAGCDTIAAADGAEAFDAFNDKHPDLVLILEAMIPKKHGFDLCREIKESFSGKSVPVIITTAVYKGRRYQAEARHRHLCDEYIELPCPDERIVASVRSLLRARSRPVPAAGEAPAGEAGEPESGGDPSKVIEFPVHPEAETVTQAETGSEEEVPTEGDIQNKLDEFFPDPADAPVPPSLETEPETPLDATGEETAPEPPASHDEVQSTEPPDDAPPAPEPRRTEPPHGPADEPVPDERIEMKMDEQEREDARLVLPPDDPRDAVADADEAWDSEKVSRLTTRPKDVGPVDEEMPEIESDLESVFDFLSSGASEEYVVGALERDARRPPADDSVTNEMQEAAEEDLVGDLDEAAAMSRESEPPASAGEASESGGRVVSRVIVIGSVSLAVVVLVILGYLLVGSAG